MTTCSLCRHYRRAQQGPHLWDVDCTLMQTAFPIAADCGLYEPPPLPTPSREDSGLGYVWDGEYEGPA